MSDMKSITENLGVSYGAWKASEKNKNRYRDEFFEAVDRELQDQIPAQSVQDVVAESEEEMLRICQRRYVRHTVVSYRKDGDVWKVVLEEDPTLRPFTYVNEEDGKVYTRVVSEGSPMLDDEGIQDEDPELWESITEEVTIRQLKDPETWTAEQAAKLEPYITMPKPQVKLGAVRKAKPEELE